MMREVSQLLFTLHITKTEVIILLLALAAGAGIAVPLIMLIQKSIYDLELRIPQTRLYKVITTLLKRGQKKNDLPAAVKRALKLKIKDDDLPDWLSGWIEHADRRIRKSGLKIPVGRYVLGMALGAIVGIFVGLVVLKNIGVAIILGLSAFLVPDVILVSFMQKKRTKMIEQLGSAVRIFSAEFKDTPQVGRALKNTAKRVPPPLGDVLSNACREIAAGYKKDTVLANMMEELEFEYGRMFVQILRIAWDDASVQPLFSRLATRIATLQLLMQKNNSSLAYGRIMSMGVNALIIPVMLMVQWKVPGAHEFMTMHPVGRLLVSISFLSVLVGLILDRILSGVDV